ncbi:kelch-like protein 40a isoform X2 [Biomphalaria glabrata]|nr:kelch protein 40a isoform X2 [Biomphalaria glabrata]
MKETKSRCVTVEDISSETFELILETLYTGHGVLTNDNVIDIWQAAHQLQITFLIKECEYYIIETLSIKNFTKYIHIASLLNSEPVTKMVWDFILKNSSLFFRKKSFLKLSMPEVLKLITCQDLVVESEDDVIYAILRWVECKFHDQIESLKGEDSDKTRTSVHVPSTNIDVEKHDTSDKCFTSTENESKSDFNEILSCEENHSKSLIKNQERVHSFSKPGTREHKLCYLLSKARLCLTSHLCLETLMSHSLVGPHGKTRDMIVRALFYQLHEGKRNGQWPSGAIYRNNATFANSALAFIKDEKNIYIRTFIISRNIWLKIPSLVCRASSSSIHFVVLEKKLYALGYLISYFITQSRPPNSKDRTPISILQFTGGSWTDKSCFFTLPSSEFSAAVNDSFIYIFSPKGKEVWKLDPRTGLHDRMSDLPDGCSIWYLMSHEHMILLFYSCLADDLKKTAIECFDTKENTWKRLNNLDGPVTDIVSFKDDHSTYLLQSSGDLWKLIQPQSNIVNFEHVVKLWNCNWPLHGAVTFMDDLYIYGVKSDNFLNDTKRIKSVNGFFQNIIYMRSQSKQKSSFIPYIANLSEIKGTK